MFSSLVQSQSWREKLWRPSVLVTSRKKLHLQTRWLSPPSLEEETRCPELSWATSFLTERPQQCPWKEITQVDTSSLGSFTPECGSCHFCRLFEQQKERITMGKSTCDTILCQNPVALFNSLMGSTRDDEDGCPFKFINGLVGLQIMTLKKLCFVSLFPKTGHSFHQVLIGLKKLFTNAHSLYSLQGIISIFFFRGRILWTSFVF